jgi:hypothetical protein
MTAHENLQLRQGNVALTYLVSQYPADAKVRKLIEALPSFGAALYRDAQEEARKMLIAGCENRLTRIVTRIAAAISGNSTKETGLANSLFDLESAVFFREVTEYIGDNTIASLLTDALLYQVTGFEAASPTEEQVLYGGTHNVRGIQKFQIAGKLMPRIADIEGWTFGSEYSAIISGRPKDFSNVIKGAFLSLPRRARVRAHVRYLLYGTTPTKAEQEAMEQWLKDGIEILKKLSSQVTATLKQQTPNSRA